MLNDEWCGDFEIKLKNSKTINLIWISIFIMGFKVVGLTELISLLFSAVGRRGEDIEEVKSEDELIELKFNLRWGGF